MKDSIRRKIEPLGWLLAIDAATRLGIKRRSVNYYCRSGQLKYATYRGHLIVSAAGVERLAREPEDITDHGD